MWHWVSCDWLFGSHVTLWVSVIGRLVVTWPWRWIVGCRGIRQCLALTRTPAVRTVSTYHIGRRSNSAVVTGLCWQHWKTLLRTSSESLGKLHTWLRHRYTSSRWGHVQYKNLLWACSPIWLKYTRALVARACPSQLPFPLSGDFVGLLGWKFMRLKTLCQM